MSGRIVVFGATGDTGRRTAHALVALGARPVLAGRDRSRLTSLADELSGPHGTPDVALADVREPGSVRDLVGRGDVLVSAVGPFARYGRPAVDAAVAAGAGYLDSTGEPTFIRWVFTRAGPRARETGAGLVTAFGYDFVPGNLAGALALAEAGPSAVRVDVGYFVDGDVRRGTSGGTRASAAGMLLEPGYAFRDGVVVRERSAARVRGFEVAGRARSGLSVGASEHFALPRLHPSLREVNVFLGTSRRTAALAHRMSRIPPLLARVPGARRAAVLVGDRRSGAVRPDQRPALSAHVVAVALDAGGGVCGRVTLAGDDVYAFTARVLARGAIRAARDGLPAGALGPVDAFGLDALRECCAEAGFRQFAN